MSNIIYKNNLKWIKDTNIRPDPLKILEKNISKTLFDINYYNIIYLSPKSREKREKKDLLKLITLCTVKETIYKIKIHPTGWEKIFANDVTDSDLISKIYK